MRNIIFSVLILAAIHPTAMAQPRFVERLPDKSGTYHNTTHEISRIVSRSDYTRTMQMMDAVVEAIKNAYPQPVGADVGPYGGIWEEYKRPSEVENGPYSIDLTIPFFELYKTSSGDTEPNGEYTSSIQIWINKVEFLLKANSLFKGDHVFRNPRPGIPVNGFPKYNNMILVLPSGKNLPWRNATRQEYLEDYIASIGKLSPTATLERQKVAEAQQMLASMSPEEKKRFAYLRKVKYMDSEFGYSQWAGFRSAGDTTAEPLVVLDQNFYDKSLPRTSFQVMVIDRRSGPQSYSAAAPRPEEIAHQKERADRLNNIVRNKELLPGLQRLMGKNDVGPVSYQQKSTSPHPLKKINRAYIDRIVDSLFRNYSVQLPVGPAGSMQNEVPSTVPDLPDLQEQKLKLAARRLETTEELVQYLDEMDKKLTENLGTTVTDYGSAEANSSASYGYYLKGQYRQSLLLAVKAAQQQPGNNLILNNLAANLSICGIDYMGVPLYIVCIKKEPLNSTLTNNLGQSYLALGDIQSAEAYLKKAISSSRWHHHANNSLGLIYEKQGRKDEAIQCYENSLRSSYTYNGYNGLLRLKRERALKLMNYIKHRYHQPDYVNFDKFILPKQCRIVDETEIRKKEYSAYQAMLDLEYRKYYKLHEQQYPVAQKETRTILERGQKGKVVMMPFMPFARAVLISVQKDFEDNLIHLQKELKILEMEQAALKMEYDTVLKLTLAEFEPRLEKLGEGNADPTLDEEICEAKNDVGNHYLPLFADNNELRYHKILNIYKDYLNDYLYWVRLSSFGKEEYQLAYYEQMMMMIRVLREMRITTINDFCTAEDIKAAKAEAFEMKEPHCPLPVGIEIPFVAGKVSLECEGTLIEAGEIIIGDIMHKFNGETTIAIGPGGSIHTPEIGEKEYSLNPAVEAVAKSQAFITFEGAEVVDWGLLWEAEIDIKGLGKPIEIKQNFTFSVVKGFSYEGQLTDLLDKIFGVPKEQKVNKHVKIYKAAQ